MLSPQFFDGLPVSLFCLVVAVADVLANQNSVNVSQQRERPPQLRIHEPSRSREGAADDIPWGSIFFIDILR